jgi:hypothetical protein
MRTFPISVLSCGLLASLPAYAADNPSDSAEDQPPPQMKLGGADTRGPGPLSVAPAEIHLPPTGQSTSDDLMFDYHGYFRAPLLLSVGSRVNPNADQSKTTFHVPAAVPDSVLGSWLYSNNVAPAWANALFSYGNRTVTGTIGVAAFNFTSSQDSGQTTANTQVSLGPVYLHFNLPGLLGQKTRVEWDVGAFGNRYGTAGKYDYGAYGMFLMGATGAIGETLGIEMDVDPITLRLEHGVGGNYYVDNKYGATLLHHVHAFMGYQQMFKLGLHYLTSWSTDDRPPATPTTSDGRLSVMGADMRFNGGIAGELYFGVAQAKASHAIYVGPVIYTVNALGGMGMRDNFFGPQNDGTGTVTSILVQYDYSFVTLARYLAHYPRSYWTDGPDLKLSLFGTLSSVSTIPEPDPTKTNYDGVKKSKFGGELIYSPLSFLSLGGRFDRVIPFSNHSDQAFSVVSPKVMIKTNFFSHDAVTIQYSRYMYGSHYPRMASCGSYVHGGCYDFAAKDLTATPPRPNDITSPGNAAGPGSINDLYGTPLDTSVSGAPYDKDLIYLAATMWW